MSIICEFHWKFLYIVPYEYLILSQENLNLKGDKEFKLVLRGILGLALDASVNAQVRQV